MVKIIDKMKLNTNALRDFLAELEIVKAKISEVEIPLKNIRDTQSLSNINVGFFHNEGDVGVIVRDLKELNKNFNSLRKRTKPVMKTLIDSLVKPGK